jgi:hypothetical protein
VTRNSPTAFSCTLFAFTTEFIVRVLNVLVGVCVLYRAVKTNELCAALGLCYVQRKLRSESAARNKQAVTAIVLISALHQ